MVNTKEDVPHMGRPHQITSWDFPASLQRYSRSPEQAYIPSVLGHRFRLSAIETPAVVIIVIPKSEIRNFNNLVASV